MNSFKPLSFSIKDELVINYEDKDGLKPILDLPVFLLKQICEHVFEVKLSYDL